MNERADGLYLLDDVVEKLAPKEVLHDHVVVARVLGVKLVDLHDVRVVQRAEDLHLGPFVELFVEPPFEGSFVRAW